MQECELQSNQGWERVIISASKAGQLSLISIDWNFFRPINLLINVDVWSPCFCRSSLGAFQVSHFLPLDCSFWSYRVPLVNYFVKKQSCGLPFVLPTPDFSCPMPSTGLGGDIQVTVPPTTNSIVLYCLGLGESLVCVMCAPTGVHICTGEYSHACGYVDMESRTQSLLLFLILGLAS